MTYLESLGVWGGGTNAANSINIADLQKQIATLQSLGSQPQSTTPVANSSPFSGAGSGGIMGTLQPYINRQTQQASSALNGGLLNYQPQSMLSGNAGGQTVATQVPQFSMDSAINKLGGFGNRSWMGK